MDSILLLVTDICKYLSLFNKPYRE